MRLKGHIAALALAAAVPTAADDLTIVTRMTTAARPRVLSRAAATSLRPPTTATSYISSHHARMVQGEGQEAIFDLATGQMTVIDGRNKQYFVVTRQDIEQMKSRLQQQMNSPEMQRAQEQMKNLPPEVQKRMQGMMGGMAGSVDVQKTGTTRKIAGYTCENWTISMGALGKTEQCMTTELALPVQVWDAYRDLADGMKGMMSAMGPMGQSFADLATKLRQIKGFPLATTTTTTVMGRTMSQSSEVVEVRKGPIPAAAWEVPAGYKKVDNPMSKAGPR
jgi:hypothetical protein